MQDTWDCQQAVCCGIAQGQWQHAGPTRTTPNWVVACRTSGPSFVAAAAASCQLPAAVAARRPAHTPLVQRQDSPAAICRRTELQEDASSWQSVLLLLEPPGCGRCSCLHYLWEPRSHKLAPGVSSSSGDQVVRAARCLGLRSVGWWCAGADSVSKSVYVWLCCVVSQHSTFTFCCLWGSIGEGSSNKKTEDTLIAACWRFVFLLCVLRCGDELVWCCLVWCVWLSGQDV